MKYQLKKVIHSALWGNTVWKDLDKEKREVVEKYAKKIGVSVYSTEAELFLSNDYHPLKNSEKFSELKFEDWFVEDPLNEIFVDSHHKKGTFMWAVDQMKQSKKVRQKSWAEDMEPLYLDQDKIWYKYKSAEFKFPFVYQDFETTDWEIFEENKFGEYAINDLGCLMMITFEGAANCTIATTKEEFDNLEKAIKKAREKCQN